MPQVTAWQCPKTGKLFLTKGRYLNHLKKKARMNLAEKNLGALRQQITDAIDGIRLVSSGQELCDYIAKHQREFYLSSVLKYYGKAAGDRLLRAMKAEEDIQFPKIIKITINTRYKQVSNSHSCPVGGVQNFMRESDKPTFYMGWDGRIVLKYSDPHIRYDGKKYDVRMTDMLDATVLNFGSGGGGSGAYSYDLRIFEADFPNMKHEKEKLICWNYLGGHPQHAGLDDLGSGQYTA